MSRGHGPASAHPRNMAFHVTSQSRHSRLCHHDQITASWLDYSEESRLHIEIAARPSHDIIATSQRDQGALWLCYCQATSRHPRAHGMTVSSCHPRLRGTRDLAAPATSWHPRPRDTHDLTTPMRPWPRGMAATSWNDHDCDPVPRSQCKVLRPMTSHRGHDPATPTTSHHGCDLAPWSSYEDTVVPWSDLETMILPWGCDHAVHLVGSQEGRKERKEGKRKPDKLQLGGERESTTRWEKKGERRGKVNYLAINFIIGR